MSTDESSLLEELSDSPSISSDLDKKEVLVDALKSAFDHNTGKQPIKLQGGFPSWWKASTSKETTPSVGSLPVEADTTHLIRSLNQKKSRKIDLELEKIKDAGNRWWSKEMVTPEHNWFDMPSTELNNEVKRDLEVLSMRGSFNSKRHYKSLEKIKEAKWVQIGTVMDNPVEGKQGRLPNRLRKRTLTQQWLVDPEMGEELQRRYLHIRSEEREMDALRAKQYPLMKRKSKRKL